MRERIGNGSPEKTRPVFFYIPDISGFTNFIKNANLKKGAHLIHDLLEVIINSNTQNFEIAEIQGDAVWFYKFDTPLSLELLEQQAIKTFIDFQAALGCLEEKYKALAGAKKLTLKIIVHYGKVRTAKIHGVLKLIGSNTVIAHHILKNNVPGNEYLLMSEQYIETQNHINRYFDWTELKAGNVFYEHLGNILYRYISLSPLRDKVYFPC